MGEAGSPVIVEQMKLTRQAIAETQRLFQAMASNSKVMLDLTEAVDALREELENFAKQIGGAKIDIEREAEVEEEEEGGNHNPVDVEPPQR
jgi:hypothetical protein